MGPDGRRYDSEQRPELSKGSVEFLANMRPYMVREPMRPEHLFLIETSGAAIELGVLRTLCAALERVLDSFVGGGFGGWGWMGLDCREFWCRWW